MNVSLVEQFKNLNPFEIALGISFCMLFLIRTLYELVLYFNLFLKKETAEEKEESMFTIIMSIRNEEENLTKHLPNALDIDDPKYEVIVVDDFSHDQSLTILGQLKESNPKLKISSLNQETRFSTKLSQNIALKASAGKWVLVFSPSINISDKNWLKNFRQAINTDTEIVVGYTSVKPMKGFFNLLCRIELFLQQLNSFAFIKMGAGYVINELNVLFVSQKYFDHGGFRGVMSEEYANMELIINKFIRKKNTEILFSDPGKVVLEEDINKGQYVELKTKVRHIIKKLSYSKRFLIAFNNISKFLLQVAFILSILFLPTFILHLSIIMGINIIIHLLIIFSALKRLNEQKIFISSLIYEFVEPYYRLFSGIVKSLPLKRK